MSPRKRASAASMLRRVDVDRARARVTSPSASPVSVADAQADVAPRRPCPHRARAAENLVASPNSTGSRPVASGSSVPAWPAFCAPGQALRRLQRRVGARPDGLVEQQHAVAACAAHSVASAATTLSMRRDSSDAALDRFVVDETQLGRGVHLDAVRELRAQEAGGALQPVHRSRRAARAVQAA